MTTEPPHEPKRKTPLDVDMASSGGPSSIDSLFAGVSDHHEDLLECCELPNLAGAQRLQQNLQSMMDSLKSQASDCQRSMSALMTIDATDNRNNEKRSSHSPGIHVVEELSEGQQKTSPASTSPLEGPNETHNTTLDSKHDEISKAAVDTVRDIQKNPKSVFVETQAIPQSAYTLFEDSIKDMPQTGDEYLKKLYGVASYPTTDLSSLLPGPIPDQDFTRAKPANQVQFSTFASFLESYFRPFVEEDLSFLKQRAVMPASDSLNSATAWSPFIIPTLGPFYLDTWAQEDGDNAGHNLSPPPPYYRIPNCEPRGRFDKIVDSVLETEEISCGPLTSRLLSALVPSSNSKGEHNNNADILDSEIAGSPDDQCLTLTSHFPESVESKCWSITMGKADFATLEDRLKREFRYVGILDNADNSSKLPDLKRPNGMSRTSANGIASNNYCKGLEEDQELDWINGREDDEICTELRALQKQLKSVTRRNQACKKRLLPIVQQNLAYQEYSQILDDLDRQVDQAYMKRIRNPTKKKKKAALGPSGTAVGSNGTNNSSNGIDARSGLKLLLNKRLRWIQKIGPVFHPIENIKRTPSQSILPPLEAECEDEITDDEVE